MYDSDLSPTKKDVAKKRHQYTDKLRYYAKRGFEFEDAKLPKLTGDISLDLAMIQKYQDDLFRKATYRSAIWEKNPLYNVYENEPEYIQRIATYKGESAIEKYQGSAPPDIENIKLANYISKLSSVTDYIPKRYRRRGGTLELVESKEAKEWVKKNIDYVQKVIENAFSINTEYTLNRLDEYSYEFDTLLEKLKHAYKENNGGAEEIQSIIKLVMGNMTIGEAKMLSYSIEDVPKEAETAIRNLTPSLWDKEFEHMDDKDEVGDNF